MTQKMAFKTESGMRADAIFARQLVAIVHSPSGFLYARTIF